MTRRICSSSTTIAASARCCCASWSARVTASPPRRGSREARAKLESLNFDLLILDVMMPGENGFDLARAIRAGSAVPILMLTARDEKESPHQGPRNRRRRLSGEAVRAARAVAARRQHPAPRPAAERSARRIRALRSVRIPPRPRGTAPRRGDDPPHRPRAGYAARARRQCRRDGACGRRLPATVTASANALSTSRSTGCAARSKAIRPIPSSSRPCAA